MNLTEYRAAQAALVLGTLSQTSNLVGYFASTPSPRAWLDFLALLFPTITQRRKESARNAYQFFRSEYVRHTGLNPDFFFPDDEYAWTYFVRDMESARKHFTQPSDDPMIAAKQRQTLSGAVDRAVARSIENAGRRAMMNAVESDRLEEIVEDDAEEKVVAYQDPEEREPEPEPEKPSKKKSKKKSKKTKRRPVVKGWARVAHGEKTCAWCLMLVSRGPVYRDTYNAGLDVQDHVAIQMYDNGEKFSDGEMNEWHPGCDCSVVPVFDTRDWPGREEAERALELWKEADKEARRIIENDPELTLSNLNREAINALRRRLYREAKRTA